MSEEKDNRQIFVVIMPWAGIREEIKIGPIRFWPWNENRVSDQKIKILLDTYFNCFVDHYGEPVKTIVVCSHSNKDFQLLTQPELNDIRSAIDILIFSSICPQVRISVCADNYSIGPPTTDRYQVIGQELKKGDQNLYIKAGSLLSVQKMDKVHISQPWCIGGRLGIEPEEELISAFDIVFDEQFPVDVRERLFHSLEWFKFAHTEAEFVSESSKLVMMSTAFEILLGFPDNRKSIYFAEQIEEHCKQDDSILETRIFNKKPVTFCKAACWAYDFYQLRNRIVHGDKIEDRDYCYKNWITFNIVADVLFWELIVKDLFKHRCIGQRAREWNKKFRPHVMDGENLNDDFFLNFTMGIDDCHRALGWTKSLYTSNGENNIEI